LRSVRPAGLTITGSGSSVSCAFKSGQFRLTIPNTYSKTTMSASLRSDCCSPSLRNAVRLRCSLSPEYPRLLWNGGAGTHKHIRVLSVILAIFGGPMNQAAEDFQKTGHEEPGRRARFLQVFRMPSSPSSETRGHASLSGEKRVSSGSQWGGVVKVPRFVTFPGFETVATPCNALI
jgi:hypothetical protein